MRPTPLASASAQVPDAQPEPSEAQPPPKPPPESQPTAAPAAPAEWWSARSAITMCSIVLTFGIIVILISCALALKKIDKDTILKIVIIPMAVMLAVFLVVAGYSDSQIAPAMGLLGTIVGYVLGTAKKLEPEPGGEASRS